MDYKKSVLSGFAWEASTKAIVQVMSWVSTIWVARLLSPDDYGIVAISGIFTGLCQMLAGMGLSAGVVNRKDITTSEVRSVFYLSLLSGAGLYLLLFAISGPVANWYNLPELAYVLRIAGTVVIISSIAIVPGAMIMRDLNFRYTALTNMGANFVLIISTLTLALMGMGFWSLILATLISQAFITILYLCACKVNFRGWIQIKEILDVFGYSVKMLGSNLTAYANHQIGQIYSSSFLGQTSTGFLQMAYTLAGLPMSKIGEIFDKVAFPSISRMKDDKAQASRVFLLMHRYLFMITCPMFIGIALISEEMITLLIGEKWLPAVVPLQLFCLLNIFRISGQLVPKVLAGMGNINASLKFQVITAIALIIALRIGVEYGLIGMLVAWLIAYPCVYIPLILDMRKTLNITLVEFMGSVYPSLLASAAMVGAVHFTINGLDLDVSLTSMVLKMVIGGVAYIAAYCIIAPSDFKKLKQFVQKRPQAPSL